MVPNKWPLLLFGVLAAGTAQAQHWHKEAPMATPPADGFYRIALRSDLTAGAQPDLADLRIRDRRGAMVPYVWYERAADTVAPRTYPIRSTRRDSTHTGIDIETDSSTGTEMLYLQMANTAVGGDATLSGSENGQDWYMVARDLQLQPGNGRDGSYGQWILFPYVRYRYLRLRIRHGGAEGVQVLGVSSGARGATPPPQAMLKHPPLRTVQRELGRETRLTVYNPQRWRIDRFRLRVREPRLYSREAVLYRGDIKDALWQGELTSADTGYLTLPPFVEDSMVLVIQNGDNPRLEIDHMATAESEMAVMAYLKGGEGYTLLSGNAEAIAPDYDLSRLDVKLPVAPPPLTYGAVKVNPPAGDASGNPENRLWLWVSLAAALAVLLFFTLRLVKGLGKAE